MRYVMVALAVLCCGGCRNGDEKDREIAALKAALAEKAVSPAPLAAKPVPPPSNPAEDERRLNLAKMVDAVEPDITMLCYNLGIKDADILDENGYIKDPTAFCKLVTDKLMRRFGRGNNDQALVGFTNTFGREPGTRMWNGTLCDGPSVVIPRPAPTIAALTGMLDRKVGSRPDAYATMAHRPLREILDERGDVKDPCLVAKAVKDTLIRQYGKSVRHVLMQSQNFGPYLGSAIYFDRLCATDAKSAFPSPTPRPAN